MLANFYHPNDVMIRTAKIINLNARGSRHNKDKLIDFTIDNEIDICLLTETLLTYQVFNTNIAYYCYKNDRDSRDGGIAIHIKKNI